MSRFGWIAGLALVALSPAASAQVGPYGALPPYEIVTILRSMDFEPVTAPVRRGPTYRLRALDADDIEVTLVVDAATGRLLSAVPVVGGPRPLPADSYRYTPGWRPAPPPVYRPYSGPRVITVPDEWDDEVESGPQVIYAPPTVRQASRAPGQAPALGPNAPESRTPALPPQRPPQQKSSRLEPPLPQKRPAHSAPKAAAPESGPQASVAPAPTAPTVAPAPTEPTAPATSSEPLNRRYPVQPLD